MGASDEIAITNAHPESGPPQPSRARRTPVHHQRLGHELESPSLRAKPRTELDVFVVREKIGTENLSPDGDLTKCMRAIERRGRRDPPGLRDLLEIRQLLTGADLPIRAVFA